MTTIAHQLHGAIGVTIEHRLWLATMRARSWVDEFGSTAQYARRLGRMALDNGQDERRAVGCARLRAPKQRKSANTAKLSDSSVTACCRAHTTVSVIRNSISPFGVSPRRRIEASE